MVKLKEVLNGIELWIDGVYCGVFPKTLDGFKDMIEAARCV